MRYWKLGRRKGEKWGAFRVVLLLHDALFFRPPPFLKISFFPQMFTKRLPWKQVIISLSQTRKSTVKSCYKFRTNQIRSCAQEHYSGDLRSACLFVNSACSETIEYAAKKKRISDLRWRFFWFSFVPFFVIVGRRFSFATPEPNQKPICTETNRFEPKQNRFEPKQSRFVPKQTRFVPKQNRFNK